MPSRVNVPDLAFALFLVCLGALIIIAFGAAMGLRAVLAGRQPFPEVAWRPLILIGAAVALFAVALPRVGLAITSVAVVIVAGYAAYDVRVRENAVLAIGIAIFAVSLFVLALGLPIPIWPPR
jgi:hypothetical protein